mgnify:CR=1 FL=1
MILPGLVAALQEAQECEWSSLAWNVAGLTEQDRYRLRCLELLMVDIEGAAHVICCRGYGGDLDQARGKLRRDR